MFFLISLFHVLLKFANIYSVQFFVSFFHSLPILMIGKKFFLSFYVISLVAIKFFAGTISITFLAGVVGGTDCHLALHHIRSAFGCS